ncbi:MAG: helix-turn-helix domain-containing protein [Oceanospirillaceae bacterium]
MTYAVTLDNNQIDLFISPRFLMFSMAICIDSVRLCNRELPDQPLQIRLLSEKGGAIIASNGISLNTQAISSQDNAATVIVLTSYEPEAACTSVVLNWIERQHEQGARMACVETASYVFAQTNLLNSRKDSSCWKLAAHFEAAPSFHQLFGDKIALDYLYSQEGNIYSSAGAMSTLDLMLHLIASLRSEPIADRIAYVFNHQRAPDSTRKPSRAEGAIARLDSRLGRMVSLMQASISTPMPLAHIYQQTGIEASTARRLFRRVLNQGPRDYYRQLRLQFARDILQNSGLSITQVAEMTGFADGSSLCRAYRQVFAMAPGKDRRNLKALSCQ